MLVAVIGCSLSVLLFQNLQNSKSQHIQSIVSNTSVRYQKILETNLRALFQEIEIAQSLYQNSNTEDAKTFKIVARPMVNRANGLVALEWIPRVTHQNLKQHQKSASLDGWSNYYVKEKSNSGEFIAVNERPYYYPIYFAEPKHNNVAVQGYDIGSNPDRLSALLNAMENNISVTTAPLTLLQNNLPNDGFLILKPVYHTNTLTDSIETRTKNLKGFIAAAISVNALLNSTFNFLTDPSSSVSLNDITEPISYMSAPRFKIDENNAYIKSSTLLIADRQWKLTIKIYKSDVHVSTLIQPLNALIIGLSITLLLMFYIYIVNTNLILTQQKVVDQRSQHQKNDQLQRIMLNTVTNAIITVNHKGTIESINPAGENMFGYPSKDIIGKNISICIPEPNNRVHGQYIEQYLRTGKSKVVGHKRIVQALHKQGHEITLELNVTELNSRDTPHFSVIAQDISAQIKLEKLSNRFLEITKMSPDFIATFNAAGTIIFANDPARKALGCSLKDDINNYRLDSIFPSDANDFFQKSKRYPDYPHSWIGESVFVTAQGQATSVSQLLISHPCNANETQNYTAFMRDITEDKESQIKILQTKKMADKIIDNHHKRIDSIFDDISIPSEVIRSSLIVLGNTDLNRSQLEQLKNIRDSEQTILSILQNSLINNSKNPTSVIDPQKLNTLKNAMSREEYADILPRYVSDTEKNIETMCTACKENHYQEIEDIAQMIKSSSANMGVYTLSNLADTLEHDIHEHHFETIPIQISNIEAEFCLVKDHLNNQKLTQNKTG